jgi:hypothetical protein
MSDDHFVMMYGLMLFLFLRPTGVSMYRLHIYPLINHTTHRSFILLSTYRSWFPPTKNCYAGLRSEDEPSTARFPENQGRWGHSGDLPLEFFWFGSLCQLSFWFCLCLYSTVELVGENHQGDPPVNFTWWNLVCVCQWCSLMMPHYQSIIFPLLSHYFSIFIPLSNHYYPINRPHFPSNLGPSLLQASCLTSAAQRDAVPRSTRYGDYNLWTKIAMENGPVIVDLPIKNGDFP